MGGHSPVAMVSAFAPSFLCVQIIMSGCNPLFFPGGFRLGLDFIQDKTSAAGTCKPSEGRGGQDILRRTVHAEVAAAAAVCVAIPGAFRASRRGARGRATSGRRIAIILHALQALTGGETPPSNALPASRIRLPRSHGRPARGVIAR